MVKRYKRPLNTIRVYKEIDNLQAIEKLYSKTVFHRLYEGGVLLGFTMPFLRGDFWDRLLSQEKCIFNTSPVARVKLVLKLCKEMRDLQEINVCHGDLHLENILIDIEQKECS